MSSSPENLPDNAVADPTGVADTVSSSHANDTKVFTYPERAAVVTPPPAFDRTILPPEPGTQVGMYVLREKIGEGVSCHVFRGRDEFRPCSVALKIVNWANVYDRSAALKQLRTEAAALARINHPHVVRFLDYGFDPRWPYLVTEYFDGRPLGEVIREGGALPAAWAVHILSQMVDALGAVWQAGVVHRDIKPDNILVDADGRAMLIDFGLAKSEAIQAREGRTGPELAGTAGYIAPEQAKDASTVDHRADIYSLGVTFYEALTGRLPFEGRNRMQVIFQHLNTPPVPPAGAVPDMPALASDLCVWMLTKNPDERPQNYDELRQAFNTVLAAMR